MLNNYNQELTKRISKFMTLDDFRTQVSSKCVCEEEEYVGSVW